jgi:hypothetical protein
MPRQGFDLGTTVLCLSAHCLNNVAETGSVSVIRSTEVWKLTRSEVDKVKRGDVKKNKSKGQEDNALVGHEASTVAHA